MTFAGFPTRVKPWTVSKLYYVHGFLRERMQMLQDEFARQANAAHSNNGWRTGTPTMTFSPAE